MKILALDLGIKTIGISITDDLQIIAIPKENYFFPEGDLEYPLKKVEEYLKKEQISLVLLGFPLKTTGEKATISYFIEEFNIQLKKITKVQLVDERYSTKRALELIPKNKLHEFKSKKDLLASWIILTDYLNSKP